MTNISAAFSRAIAQLGDPAIMRILAKTILLTLAIFAALGAALWFGLYRELINQNVTYSAEIGALVAVLATIIGGWILFRIVALAVLQFFADEVVRAVEAKYYPASLSQARSFGWSEEFGHSVRSIARAVGVNLVALALAAPLIFTAIGPAVVFWAANGWLLGRELQDMVWLRHRHSPGDPAPLGRFERFTLGGIVTALLAVPFVNLLAPIIGAASAAHLVHGRITRENNGATYAP